MNNPVWIDDKGKIVEPEYCRDFLSQHPMRCINDRFYTVDGPLPDESKLKRTIYEEISPWLHAKVAQTVEQIIKALKLAAYADPLPLQCDRIHVASQNAERYHLEPVSNLHIGGGKRCRGYMGIYILLSPMEL